MKNPAAFFRQQCLAYFRCRRRYALGSDDRAHTVKEARAFLRHYRDAMRQGDEYDIFDDVEALTALAVKSFQNAAKKAVAENDRLGIPSSCSVDGKLMMRLPYPPHEVVPLSSLVRDHEPS